MALSTFVYIRNVDNLSDARYCAGMGVDLVGFNLDPSDPKSLDKEKFKEISEWISGVKIVGEFGKATPSQLKEILPEFKVDYLLVNEISILSDYESFGIPLILQLSVNANIDDRITELNYSSGTIDLILINSNQDAISNKEKSYIKAIAGQYTSIIGFGVNEQNAIEIVSELGLEGISLAGSSEIRPGFKDYEELADILEALEID